MHAIILAAGYATRMYPLTQKTPKPLLPLSDKVILDYIIEKIPKEIKKIHVVTNALFIDQFVRWQENNKEITLTNDETTSNETRLEGPGDILFTLKKQNIDDDLLVIAGDNLFEFDLQKMLDFFKQKNAPIVAASNLENKSLLAKKFGVIEIDKNNKIISFEEKPESPRTSLASTACYIIPKSHIPLLKEFTSKVKEKKALGYFIIWLMQRRDVYATVYNKNWYDIGSFEDYNNAQEIYKNR